MLTGRRDGPRDDDDLRALVDDSGIDDFDVLIANIGTGAQFRVAIDNVDRTGLVNVPNTGGWQAWQTLTKSGLSLTAGAHVVTLLFETGTAENGGVGNYNWLRFRAASASATPYGGTPVALPGTVEAERFDEGGSGVAYVDTTAGNGGGQYRSTDVDIDSTTDTGGGYNVGRTRPGSG